MNLYIRIENGTAVDHPAFEDNLIGAFGSIPDNWAPFTRVEQHDAGLTVGVYQTAQCSYTLGSDGVTWQDTWTVRDMTDAERSARQQVEQAVWAAKPNRENFAAWTFDEATCDYVPPTARPADGNYAWRGTDNSWVAVPAYPEDGNTYRFDLTTGAWVAQS